MFTYPICPPPCRFNTTPRRLLVAYLFKMARIKAFQHTAARRRLEENVGRGKAGRQFQHTAAQRRLGGCGKSGRGVWLFQHTAARRRLGRRRQLGSLRCRFQHTAAQRRLGPNPGLGGLIWPFQHTAARRRLGKKSIPFRPMWSFQHTAARRRLGSMPTACPSQTRSFQHTAARRRLGCTRDRAAIAPPVSTHSRPKAAGRNGHTPPHCRAVSTHSRPKAAGAACLCGMCSAASFNTQPPEGGWADISGSTRHMTPFQHTAARRRLGHCPRLGAAGDRVSTHSRPKAAGVAYAVRKHLRHWFQHTAARRRLGFGLSSFSTISSVSTHSRPKAAGGVFTVLLAIKNSFNTQPPEGGWGMDKGLCLDFVEFQHTAARRRLGRCQMPARH